MKRLSKALLCLAATLILLFGAALTVHAADLDTITVGETKTLTWSSSESSKFAYLTVNQTGYYDISIVDLYDTAYLEFYLHDMDSATYSSVWYDTYLYEESIDGSYNPQNIYLLANHTYELRFRYGYLGSETFSPRNASISIAVNQTYYTPTSMTLGQYTNVALGTDAIQWLEFRTTSAGDYLFEANKNADWYFDIYEKSSGAYVDYSYDSNTLRISLKANTNYIIVAEDNEESAKLIRLRVSKATKNISSITINSHDTILAHYGYFYDDGSSSFWSRVRDNATYKVTYSDNSTATYTHGGLANLGIDYIGIAYKGATYTSYNGETFFKIGSQPVDVNYMNKTTRSYVSISSYNNWLAADNIRITTDKVDMVIEYEDQDEYTYYWYLKPNETNNYQFYSTKWDQISNQTHIFDKNNNMVPFVDGGWNLVAGELYSLRISYTYNDDCYSDVTFWLEPHRNHVHSYSGSCDTTCNVCSNVRTAASHTYSSNSDKSCNVCGSVSAYPGGNTLVYENGYWRHISNRQKVYDTTLVYFGSNWYYVKNGVVNYSNTLCNWNGKWYHVNNGTVVKDTTLVYFGSNWYYVKNGVVDYSNSLCNWNGKWWHVKNGTVVKDTTLVNFAGSWYYVKNGVVDYNSTTLCSFAGKWYYVKGGKVNYSNTLCNWNGKWYHVKNGTVVYDTTLVNFAGKWYYVKDGVLNYGNTLCNFSGKWYHVKNGNIVYDTTLVNFAGSWYYVKNGVVDFSATTLVSFSGKWYYVKNGKVDYSNTLCSFGGKWYHVKNGNIVYDTTLVYFSGKWYFVRNGVVDFNYSGRVLFSGSYYVVKKGVKL